MFKKALSLLFVLSFAALALAQDAKLDDKAFQEKAQKVARRITLKLAENQRDPSLYKSSIEKLEKLLAAAANPTAQVVQTARLFKANLHLELKQGKECLAELETLEKSGPSARSLNSIYQYRAKLFIRQRNVKALQVVLAQAKKKSLEDETVDAIKGSLYLLRAREFSKKDRRDDIIRLIKDAEADRVDYKTVSLMKREIARCAFALGKEFPGFKVKDSKGRDLSVASYKGKVVLIDFWASWCGPCRASLPALVELYEKYQSKGFEVIGVSLDENPKRFEHFVKRQGMSWSQYYDGKGWKNKLARQYLVDSLPATFLLDKEGKVLAKDIRVDELEDALKKALNIKESPKK